MKKLLLKLGVALALVGTLFGIGAGIAAAAPAGGHGGGSRPAVSTAEYWTTDQGVSAVVKTSGVNISKTASFTISAAPYNGATFLPSDGNSAFNNYLQQIGEFVNGPGTAPAGNLTLVWSGKNAYTNNVETYVYAGPGDKNDSAAQTIALLLKTGLPYVLP